MNLFDIKDRVILITGGGGVLAGSMAGHLLEQGARIVLIDYKQEPVEAGLKAMERFGDRVVGYVCNVLERERMEEVAGQILENYGRIDVLINAAGGNMPGATIGPDQTIFDLKMEDFEKVVDLNLFGSVLPSLVFGAHMAKAGKGVILNISSMTAQQAITRVVGYSASKAAIDNFTKWMAVELATKFGDGIRVNAIAPGFFIGNQNRALLVKDDGSYTDRGHTIIAKTPMKRFGEAEELNGAIHFLCSEASRFITGVVLPIDGGFSAFSGV